MRRARMPLEDGGLDRTVKRIVVVVRTAYYTEGSRLMMTSIHMIYPKATTRHIFSVTLDVNSTIPILCQTVGERERGIA